MVLEFFFVFLLFIVDVNEECGFNLYYVVYLGLCYVEVWIDYMGICILMGNLFVFKIDLSDEWIL